MSSKFFISHLKTESESEKCSCFEKNCCRKEGKKQATLITISWKSSPTKVSEYNFEKSWSNSESDTLGASIRLKR